MNFIFLDLLIFAYEFYYVSHFFANSRIFLFLKIGALIVCTTYASLQIKMKAGILNLFDSIVLGFYILLIFTSSIYSINSLYVIIYGFMFCCLLLFVYCCSVEMVVENRYDVLKFIPVFFTTLIIVSLLGFFLKFRSFFYVDVWGNTRVNGVFGEPSRLAQIGALNIFFLFHFLKKKFLWLIILTLISFVAIFLAGNRSYMLALMIIAYFHVVQRLLKNKTQKVVFVLFTVCLVSIVALMIKNDLTGIRYLRMESVGTLSGRTEVWVKVLPDAIKKPFGDGYMLGGTEIVDKFEKKRGLFQSQKGFSLLSPGAFKSTLHNGYLQSLCDLGPIGLILYLIIFSRGLYFAYKNRFIPQQILFVNIIVFFTIVNMSSTVLVSPTVNNTVLYWLAWFVLMASYRKSRKLSSSNTFGRL